MGIVFDLKIGQTLFIEFPRPGKSVLPPGNRTHITEDVRNEQLIHAGCSEAPPGRR
jgi:hypothetical protein